MKTQRRRRKVNYEGIAGILLILANIWAIIYLLNIDSKEISSSTVEHSAVDTNSEEKHEKIYIKEFIAEDYGNSLVKASTYKLVNANGPIEFEKSIDSEDITLLAKLIEAEGGEIPIEARARIGSVVINRKYSDLFPDTVQTVIFQPDQYETVSKGLLPDFPNEENLELAEWLLENSQNREFWYDYCIELGISDKTVYQANSSIDMNDYAYKILDEYGVTEYGYEWHMCYWESIDDYTDIPYSEIIITP